MVTISVRSPEKSDPAPILFRRYCWAPRGILPGGCRRQAPLPFDEALREKVFFGYQVLIQVSRTRGTPRLFFAVPRSTKVSYRSTIVLMPRSFLMVWGLSTSFKQFGKREKKIPSSKGRRNATFELNIGSPSRAAAGVRTASLRSAVIAATALIAFTLAGNRPRLHRRAGRGLLANKFFLLPCRRPLRLCASALATQHRTRKC